MYANGHYWEAKVRGAGGVARSKGKEHLFLGSETWIFSSDTVVTRFRDSLDSLERSFDPWSDWPVTGLVI